MLDPHFSGLVCGRRCQHFHFLLFWIYATFRVTAVPADERLAIVSAGAVQATDIDVTSECPAGHGRVTCWSVYGGPDIDFRSDDLQCLPDRVPACVLYIDTYLRGNESVPEVIGIWDALREFLESDDFPKVCPAPRSGSSAP
jgi:hypothetical protein